MRPSREGGLRPPSSATRSHTTSRGSRVRGRPCTRPGLLGRTLLKAVDVAPLLPSRSGSSPGLIMLAAARGFCSAGACSTVESTGARLWRRVAPGPAGRAAPGGVGARSVSGLAWGWLPCGMTYSMLLLAATTASVAAGRHGDARIRAWARCPRWSRPRSPSNASHGTPVFPRHAAQRRGRASARLRGSGRPATRFGTVRGATPVTTMRPPTRRNIPRRAGNTPGTRTERPGTGRGHRPRPVQSGHWMLIASGRAFSTATRGRWMYSTPSFDSARIKFHVDVLGSTKLRSNMPKKRSVRCTLSPFSSFSTLRSPFDGERAVVEEDLHVLLADLRQVHLDQVIPSPARRCRRAA